MNRYIRIGLFLFLSTVVFNSKAQVFEFTPLESIGPVPDVLKKSASEKARNAMQEVKKKDINNSNKKLQEAHIAESTFFIDEILNSGKVVYGDIVSNFINTVADKLLAQDQKLRAQLHFYTLRSSVPNAFATATGDVFVSTGLLATLQNEAQLAFVLSHEIQHFARKHNLKAYQKLATMKRNTRGSFESMLQEYYNFSKENEKEADALGLKLFLSSGYTKQQAVEAFKQLGHLEEPFLKNGPGLEHLNSGHYFVGDELSAKVADAIKDAAAERKKSKSEADEKEKYSTHPDLESRISLLEELLSVYEGEEDKGFLYSGSKEAFDLVATQCQYETVYNLLLNAEYGASYYLCCALDSTYGSCEFLRRMKAYSLYGIFSMNKENDKLDKIGFDLKHKQGAWQPLLAAVNNIPLEEVLVFAARELYKTVTANPTPFGNKLLNAVMVDLVLHNGTGPDEIRDGVELLKKEEHRGGLERNNYTTAFGSLLQDTAFVNFAGRIWDAIPEEMTSDSAAAGKSVTAAHKASHRNEPLKHVLMFAPVYSETNLVAKYKKHSDVQFNEDKLKRMMSRSFELSNQHLQMQVEMPGGGSRSDNNTDALNRYQVMSDWLTEMISTRKVFEENLDFTSDSGGRDMILFSSSRMQEKLGTTDHLGIIVYNQVIRKRQLGSWACVLFVPPFIYLLPVTLAWALTPEKKQYYTMLVWNSESGGLVGSVQKTFSKRLSRQTVNTHIYDLLYRLQYHKI